MAFISSGAPGQRAAEPSRGAGWPDAMVTLRLAAKLDGARRDRHRPSSLGKVAIQGGEGRPPNGFLRLRDPGCSVQEAWDYLSIWRDGCKKKKKIPSGLLIHRHPLSLRLALSLWGCGPVLGGRHASPVACPGAPPMTWLCWPGDPAGLAGGQGVRPEQWATQAAGLGGVSRCSASHRTGLKGA